MIEKIELLESKDGYKVIKVSKGGVSFNIGSLYNEKREIEVFLKSIGSMTNEDNYIVFGLGFLNHIKELIENKSCDSKILVVECSPDNIELMIENADEEAKRVIRNKDLFITSEEDQVDFFLRNYVNVSNLGRLKVLPYSGYGRYFKKEIQPFLDLIKQYCLELKINNDTICKFEDEWYRHSIETLRYLSESRTLYPYKNAYLGKPAIIVSAGPSLDRNISLLKERRDAVIISGGRTLQSLLNIGVDPDFLTIVDASRKSYELVANHIELTHAKLVYYFGIPKEILAAHKGDKIIFSEDSVIREFLQENMILLYGGGSVAHAMTNLAIQLGCDPIVFIGQDLAYTNDQEHSQLASSPWSAGATALTTEEISNSLFVDDVFGNKVRTNWDLDLFKRQLERIIESNKDRTFLNCTEGGANIKGAEALPLHEIYNDLPSTRPAAGIEHSGKRKIDPIKILKENRRYMMRSINQYAKAVKIIDSYIKLVECDIVYVELVDKELSKIESSIKRNNKRVLFIDLMINKRINFLHSSMHFAIFNSDTRQEALIKNLTKSRFLYAGLGEKLKEYIKVVDDEIMSLQKLSG